MNSYKEKIKVTKEKVEEFAKYSGDYNSLHTDEEFAKNSIFGARIAHGMIFGAIILKILGTNFLGEGTIYLEQNLKFLKPIYIGETVQIEVKILGKKENKPIYSLSTNVYGINKNSENFSIKKLKVRQLY